MRPEAQGADRTSPGACLGTFPDATNEISGGVPRMPTRGDITRDVDLLDIGGDGDQDILFTNATLMARLTWSWWATSAGATGCTEGRIRRNAGQLVKKAKGFRGFLEKPRL